MAATGSQWNLKTDDEQYLSGLERKLAHVKASSTATREPAVNGVHSPTKGFLLPRGVNGDADEGSSSFSGSTDDGSTIIPADDEEASIEDDAEPEDASAEGRALLLDPADHAGAVSELRSPTVGSPVDFSRGAILRPPLVRQEAAEAFSVSPPSRFRASGSAAVTPRPPLKQILAESHETFATDSDSAHDEDVATEDEDEDDDAGSVQVVHGVVVAGADDNKRHSIKFHDTVRIHGGIKRPKRRRRPRLPPNATSASRSPISVRGREASSASHQYSPRDPSPLRELFTDLKPVVPSRPLVPTGTFLDSGPPTPTSSTFGTGPGTGHTTTTPSGFPFHRPPRSSSPAAALQTPYFPFANRSRRPSSTMSFRGGDGYGSGFASVLTSATQSRSSSPASSIYAPLRVPAVRAPAPFFGPTPERLLKMREKREAARREEQRSKGGLRGWWFGSGSGKGKKKAVPAVEVDEDEENAPCYHDVIIEQERVRRARRLSRLSSGSLAPIPPDPPPPAEGVADDDQRWFWQRWLSGKNDGPTERSPLIHKHHHHSSTHLHPAFPIHGPLPSPAPGRGRPLSRSRPGLLSGSATSLPNVSEDDVMTTSSPAAVTPPTASAQPPPTPMDPRSPVSSRSPAPSPSVFSAPFAWLEHRQRRAKRRRRLEPKTEVYVRFGPAPRRWFKGAWWRWRWRIVRRWLAEKRENLAESWREWWEDEEDWEDEAQWHRV